MKALVFKKKETGASRPLYQTLLLLFITVSMSKLLSSSDGGVLCQVSLDEGAGASVEDEVLQRAAGFFVDNNENYTVRCLYFTLLFALLYCCILCHFTVTTGELGRGLAHDLGQHGRPLPAPNPRRQQGVSAVEAAEGRGEHLLPSLHTRPHPHRPGQ